MTWKRITTWFPLFSEKAAQKHSFMNGTSYRNIHPVCINPVAPTKKILIHTSVRNRKIKLHWYDINIINIRPFDQLVYEPCSAYEHSPTGFVKFFEKICLSSCSPFILFLRKMKTFPVLHIFFFIPATMMQTQVLALCFFFITVRLNAFYFKSFYYHTKYFSVK